MSKTVYLNEAGTAGFQYRPALPGDTYVCQFKGDDVAIQNFFGFTLKSLKPSTPHVETFVMGKADSELLSLGLVDADELGNEITKKEAGGGEVDNHEAVCAELQKILSQVK